MRASGWPVASFPGPLLPLRREPGNEARTREPGNEARRREPGNEARRREPGITVRSVVNFY